jgi:hypothetical protein
MIMCDHLQIIFKLRKDFKERKFFFEGRGWLECKKVKVYADMFEKGKTCRGKSKY